LKRGLLLIWLFLANAVQAAGPLPPPNDEKTLDFAVRFTHYDTVFDYGATNVDTTVKWIDVSWQERFGQRLRLGLFGGYSFLTQTNNAPTAGIELDGYHAGVSLDVSLLQMKRVNLYFEADYTYQKVDHDGENQNVDIEWHEASVKLGAAVNVSGGVRLYGGGNYGYVDGRERATGTVNRTTNFDRLSRSGGFLGLDLNVGKDGYIGIEGRWGLRRGGEIYFKKLF